MIRMIPFTLPLLFFVCSLGYGQETVISEQAVFRVQSRIFSLTDVNSYIKNVRKLQCLYPESLLLKGTGLEREQLPDFSRFKGIVPNLSKYIGFFDKLVALFKIQEFVARSSVGSRSGMSDRFVNQSCVDSDWSSWPADLKSLANAELFVQDRFNQKNIYLFCSAVKKKIQHDYFIRFD